MQTISTRSYLSIKTRLGSWESKRRERRTKHCLNPGNLPMIPIFTSWSSSLKMAPSGPHGKKKIRGWEFWQNAFRETIANRFQMVSWIEKNNIFSNDHVKFFRFLNFRVCKCSENEPRCYKKNPGKIRKKKQSTFKKILRTFLFF